MQLRDELLNPDIPDDVLLTAVLRAPKRSEFYPTWPLFAKLFDEIIDEMLAVEHPELKALSSTEAWELVVPHLSDSGRKADNLPEAVQRAVHCVGGWFGLGQGTWSERHFVEKRFKESYNDIVAGWEETTNRRKARAAAIEQLTARLASPEAPKALPSPDAEKIKRLPPWLLNAKEDPTA